MWKNFVMLVVTLCVPLVSTQDLKLVLSQRLKTPSPNVLATSVLLTYQPGDKGIGAHTHSGPVVGYVFEGDLLFQVEGRDPVILSAGDGFYEDDKSIHLWGANASNDTLCIVFATVYGRPEEEFVIMTPEKKRDDYETVLSQAMDLQLEKSTTPIIEMENTTSMPDAETPKL